MTKRKIAIPHIHIIPHDDTCCVAPGREFFVKPPLCLSLSLTLSPSLSLFYFPLKAVDAPVVVYFPDASFCAVFATLQCPPRPLVANRKLGAYTIFVYYISSFSFHSFSCIVTDGSLFAKLCFVCFFFLCINFCMLIDSTM